MYIHCLSKVVAFVHLSHRPMVSYCDHWMSVVRCASYVVNNCFKGHLLLNYSLDFYQPFQE